MTVKLTGFKIIYDKKTNILLISLKITSENIVICTYPQNTVKIK